jgi:hypothetical protein
MPSRAETATLWVPAAEGHRRENSAARGAAVLSLARYGGSVANPGYLWNIRGSRGKIDADAE